MGKKPDWLKIKIPGGENYVKIKKLIDKYNLNTICSSGQCPNIAECWNAGTATFMILGDTCTRNCKFCATNTGTPSIPDIDEPLNIAKSVNLLKLKHCVITSVTRDDLPDQGAKHWAHTILKIKELNPNTTCEVLIPDFSGNSSLIDLIINAKPDIISHNLETVKRLTPLIRNKAKYDTSLAVIKYISNNKITAKSGIMIGMGETEDEIFDAFDDLLDNGCKILTIGQYLQPSKNHWPVYKYYTPQQFSELKEIALKKGFALVESNPLVRSSYHAEKHLL
jgi:lipoic acid synthetase